MFGGLHGFDDRCVLTEFVFTQSFSQRGAKPESDVERCLKYPSIYPLGTCWSRVSSGGSMNVQIAYVFMLNNEYGVKRSGDMLYLAADTVHQCPAARTRHKKKEK